MGHFDETICDCCVCPMQCVLKQLVGEEVRIFTINDSPEGTLTDVDDFIAVLDTGGGNIVEFPIHNICAVEIAGPFVFKLKPIKKSVGECSCIEDPTTKLAQSKIGKETSIQAGRFCEEGTIIAVGEGIVIISSRFSGNDTSAVSSCKIETIGRSCE